MIGAGSSVSLHAMAKARRVDDELEARRCLQAVAASGRSLGAWAREQGIDGRSLNAWRVNLGRRENSAARPTKAPVKQVRGGLVELVPTSRPTALGGTGIAVGLVGVAALAAGCSMIVAEPKPLGPHDAVLERDRHPPAVPLLAAGGAALLGGVTMVVLDITRCRRNAAARGCDSRDLETVPPATSRRPRVRLNVSSRDAGVVVQGRF